MIKNNSETLSKLKHRIALSRQKLNHLWNDRGNTDPEVLDASIEFDDLLNTYQKVKSKTKSS